MRFFSRSGSRLRILALNGTINSYIRFSIHELLYRKQPPINKFLKDHAPRHSIVNYLKHHLPQPTNKHRSLRQWHLGQKRQNRPNYSFGSAYAQGKEKKQWDLSQFSPPKKIGKILTIIRPQAWVLWSVSKLSRKDQRRSVHESQSIIEANS